MYQEQNPARLALTATATKIENGEWMGIINNFPLDVLAQETETFCHAALLSASPDHACAFIDALAERICNTISPEYRTLVLSAKERLHQVMEDGGWLPPEPLHRAKETIHNPFPKEVFPPYLERFCDSVAESTQTSRPMISAAVLAAAALSVQGKFRIAYPSGNGHAENLCLYLVIVANPGERKSAVFAHALAPIRAWQTEARETYRMKMAEYLAKKEKLECETNALRRQMNRTKGETDRQTGDALTGLLLASQELTAPPSPEIIAMDTTAEALANLLEATHGIAGIFTDESDFFKIIAGLYNKGHATNLGLILKAYDGSPFFRLRGSGTVTIERPLITMCLFAQPLLFAQTQGNDDLQGRGMIGRLLFCEPESMAGKRDVTVSTRVDGEAAGAYENILRGYLDRELPADGEGELLTFEEDAAMLMLRYLQKLENSMQEGHSMEQAADYASKAGGAALRIAGILALLWQDGNAGEVRLTADVTRRAIQLHKYFFGEKVRGLQQEDGEDTALVQQLMERLIAMTLEKGLSHISASVLQQSLKRTKGFRDIKKFWQYLGILEDMHWIATVKGKRNRREVYVSPKARNLVLMS